MSMLYLASYIATSAVRLSGRLAPSRSRRVDAATVTWFSG